ncbi:MAG: carbohydrate ABC transporter permease [Armatimonadetes bacterium]|nr:carbohydrate ABC transporter permease [Armatimonadota bacterium]
MSAAPAHGSLYASRRRSEARGRAVAYALLLAGTAVFLIPFAFMLSTSLKDKDQIFSRNIEWIPRRQVVVKVGKSEYPVYRTSGDKPLYLAMLERLPAGKLRLAVLGRERPDTLPYLPAQTQTLSEDSVAPVKTWGARWQNYTEALTPPNFRFLLYLRNTLLITFFALVGQVASCCLVAFGFARLRFPGRNALFIVLLSTMMLPAQVTMVPLFKIFVTLGWYDTFLPLTVPAFFATSGFFVFLLRQYFMSIPLEMDEAARIDGASTAQVFGRVILPQIKPAVATVAIFSFMGHWNDFLGPLIYLGNPDLRTLALGLYAFQGEHSVDVQLLMAAATVVMLPLLALFAAAQRYFIQGVVISGVKG